jgi:hypothetical protein
MDFVGVVSFVWHLLGAWGGASGLSVDDGAVFPSIERLGVPFVDLFRRRKGDGLLWFVFLWNDRR